MEFGPELDLVHQHLGHAYLQKGMTAEAITAMRRAAELSGERDSTHLAHACAVTGARSFTRFMGEFLNEEENSSCAIASAHAPACAHPSPRAPHVARTPAPSPPERT
jgi:heme oxygenase